MHAVFRVKRRLDEKQLTGVRIAKRQRLGTEDPIILTYAGTTSETDSGAVLSVIKSHQEQGRDVIPVENGVDGESGDEEIPTAASADLPVAAEVGAVSSNREDIDEIFRIFDACQTNIANPKETIEGKDPRNDPVDEDNSEFVYDIYYLHQDPSSRGRKMNLDYDEQNFRLERWNPENEELVNEGHEAAEDYDDEDSNAEDNPNNDYPDEEDRYSDNGGEVPHSLEDDDYYSYEGYNHMSVIEQRLQELDFFGADSDSD
ncbi:probable RNA polymerase II nuclear localization protein SLC7A6OS [Galendromus occidentalis]|uniref:Probable RNA polymerase II nuclear localization protein SLC7A6OS n=1 Tax=Galendromus occidentalis TaxID=34638 RepID=A0AAJ7P9D1_9ACAR|nr:probable RNA polymerase II nuclear localization protein SLC7A6OS [Galendromus occidentalis]